MSWLEENRINIQHTGRHFIPQVGIRRGCLGELVNILPWGGYILEFKHNDGVETITYTPSDLREISPDELKDILEA